MSKESKVLENITKTSYTVHLNDLFITGCDFSRGAYFFSNNSARERANLFTSIESATKAAKAVGGKIKKHTFHQIKTEEIEEVEINE